MTEGATAQDAENTVANKRRLFDEPIRAENDTTNNNNSMRANGVDDTNRDQPASSVKSGTVV